MTLTAGNITKTGYFDARSGKAHSGERMEVGMNVGRPHYYVPHKPYLNWIYGNVGFEYFIGNGWPDATTSDKNYTVSACDYIETGTYRLQWTGTATASVSQMGSVDASGNDGVPAPNTTYWQEYSIGAAYNHKAVVITFSGGTCENPKLYNTAYQAEMDAGKYLHPGFVAEMEVYECIRFLDWINSNESPWETFADYPTVNDPSWTMGAPMQVIAELCEDADAEPWIPVPCHFDAASVNAYATDLYTYLPALRADGITPFRVRVEYGNEIWNTIRVYMEGRIWTQYMDQTLNSVQHAGGGVLQKASHGYTTGGYAVTVSNNNVHQWPWGFGGTMRIIKKDNDNFYFGRDTTKDPFVAVTGTHTGADGSTTSMTDNTKSWFNDKWILNGRLTYIRNTTKGCDGIITTNTSDTVTFPGGLSDGAGPFVFDNGDSYIFCIAEDPESSGFTLNGQALPDINNADFIPYFDRGAGGAAPTDPTLGLPVSSQAVQSRNSARKHEIVWDEFDDVFGRDRVVHVAGGRSNTSTIPGEMAVYLPFVKKMDYYCTAYYWGDFPSNWATMSGLDFANWMNSGPTVWNNRSSRFAISEFQHTRGMGYEGTGSTLGKAINEASFNIVKDWMFTDEDVKAWHLIWLQRMREIGYTTQCIFFGHGELEDYTWTNQASEFVTLGNIGQTTTHKTLHAELYDEGGVSKR